MGRKGAFIMTVAAMTGFALTAAGCGAGGAGSSAAAQGVTGEVISIGTTTALSGVSGPFCRSTTDAAHIWFEHVNNGGGINGRKITEEVLDDQYTAPGALANAKEFVRKPVFAIFGGCGSIQPPAIQTVAKPAGIPYVFPTASLPDLVGDSNAFLALPLYSQQMSALTTYAEQKFGAGSVYVVSQQIPGIKPIVDSVTKATTDAGQKLAGTDTFIVGQPDLGPTILKIKQAHPDYLVMNAGADAARLFQGLAAQGALPHKKILGWSSILTTGNVAGSKALPDRMLVAASATPAPDSPELKECAAVLDAASPGLSADSFADFSCASAQAFTHALEAAGKNLTRESFKKELLSWKDKTASAALPPLTFTDSNRAGATGAFAVTASGGVVTLLDRLTFS